MYQAVEPYFDLIYPHEAFARAFASAVPVVINHLGKSADLRILDLCCGTGRALGPFSRLPGATVWGVDQSASMLEKAKRRFPSGRFFQRDVRCLTPHEFGIRSFDVVIIAGVSLLHFTASERSAILSFAERALCPGGVLIFDILRIDDERTKETFIKGEFEVDDRTVVVVYHRVYGGTVAFHTAAVLELPRAGCDGARLTSDCFNFYPLNASAARNEAIKAGFDDLGLLETEYRASSFLCFSVKEKGHAIDTNILVK
jgi:SAM-dependent methyltransferase